MPNFTRNAIKESFMKLLCEQPLNKISVREIVEDCGINRNSFYYHFHDIPSLIEEIVKECFDVLIQKYPNVTSLNEGVNAAIQFILENKNALLHIYHSVNRDIFERYLMKFCEDLIVSYLDTAFADQNIPEYDKNLIIRCLKCELFGVCVDWMNSNMPDSITDDAGRIFEICHGLSYEIIRRCGETTKS